MYGETFYGRHTHRLEMTEILLKGRKTLTHPSITAATLHNTSCSEGK